MIYCFCSTAQSVTAFKIVWICQPKSVSQSNILQNMMRKNYCIFIGIHFSMFLSRSLSVFKHDVIDVITNALAWWHHSLSGVYFYFIIIIVYTFHSQEIIKYINNAVAINLNVLNISHCTFAVEENEIKEWSWEMVQMVEMGGRLNESQEIAIGI